MRGTGRYMFKVIFIMSIILNMLFLLQMNNYENGTWNNNNTGEYAFKSVQG